MAELGPRLVVAGTSSGTGKTTVATGLLAALRRAGHRPAAAKVGPDFIDPGYHALACGRPPRNLDPWMCGTAAIGPLAARAGAGADVLVIEGVMGLFDGAADGSPSSTADVAALLDAPVVLVVDASATSRSVAAIVHGFATFDPSVHLAGVVLNRVGSDSHEEQLRSAIAPLGLPVLGALRRDDRFIWRDRHLGLVPVAEHPDEVTAGLDVLAGAVAAQLDLEAVLQIARAAPTVTVGAPALPSAADRPTRVGVLGGRAFTFTYTDTLEALAAGGADVVTVDPLHDAGLPSDLDGLLLGGGFPETFGAELADNTSFRSSLREVIDRGLTTWAECGGLMLLCRSIDGHDAAGLVPAAAAMGARLTLGYRAATTRVATPLGSAGTTLRGHEFHYSSLDQPGDALELTGAHGTRLEGHATPSLLATYLHHHPGGDPAMIEAFLATCAGG
jgi:cobyrinic acid a,c-diamide synthase